jgi:hypothetical protein
VSPGGRYVLFFEADHYWTIDLDTRVIVNITKSAPTSFTNRESDAAVKQKPPFGVAGWTKDDGAVLLYDQFDIWQVAPTALARRSSPTAPPTRCSTATSVESDEEFIDTRQARLRCAARRGTKKSGRAAEPGRDERHAPSSSPTGAWAARARQRR